MHDRLDHHGMNDMNDEASLIAALRALPANAPPQDAWRNLSARIGRRRTVRRAVWFSLPAAFAAGVALAFAWPHLHLPTSSPAPAPVAQTPSTAKPDTRPVTDVAALQASSAQWQNWVQNLSHNGAPLDGRALANAVALQDRIGMIDLQLSAARSPATAAGLWQQRITLLQQLGLLHLQPYAVAEQTRPAYNRVMSM
jgi:anti-sigma factor RsiW